jgi:hypothetical protein
LTNDAPRRFVISTRLLDPTASSKNLTFSRRDISVPSSTKNDNLNSRDKNHGQVRSTPTPPHSICSSNPGQMTSIKDGKFENIFLNPGNNRDFIVRYSFSTTIYPSDFQLKTFLKNSFIEIVFPHIVPSQNFYVLSR